MSPVRKDGGGTSKMGSLVFLLCCLSAEEHKCIIVKPGRFCKRIGCLVFGGIM